MKKEEQKQFFLNRINTLETQYKKANQKYLIYSLSRLLVFIIGGGSLFLIYPSSIMVWVFLGGTGLFLFSVIQSVETKYKRDKIRRIIEINQEELSVMEGDWSAFANGKKYQTAGHPYAEDVDLWGEGGIYQLLNRTVSQLGADALAHHLGKGTHHPEITQQGIKEMMQHAEWAQDFCAEGRMNENEEKDATPLSALKELNTKAPAYLTVLGVVFPLIAWAAVFAFNYDVINFSQFLLIGVLALAPVGFFLSKINPLAKEILTFEGRINIIKKQLEAYQNLSVQQPLIQEHRDTLFQGKEAAITGLNQLDTIYKGFEFRNNAVVGLLLNFFFSWDLHLLRNYSKWWNTYHNELEGWETKLADIEVWISGATFALQREIWCFAEFHDQQSLAIKRIKHPFVNEKIAIPNDVMIHENQNFHIITGPNMAGKSTYLRCIGLSFVFAHAGFPIPAQSCKIPRLKLYSSMRTADDLSQESSYFHAELSRLRFIVDAIEKGEKVFIVLDEILKGTNSHDKAEGSAKFLMKLKKMNAKGVIATHDLSLCDLAKNDPAFHNVFFDSTITGKKLDFDYKVKEGICQNMNASFLLQQMGLIENE